MSPFSKDLIQTIQHKIDTKTKPLGSLGALESLAFQIANILKSDTPQLKNPALFVFAGDHGLTSVDGVSAFPSAVTEQMVYNFCAGGAAINAFCKQHGIQLQIVDAGVQVKLDPNLPIIHAKVCLGTQNSLLGPALSSDELQVCLEKGQEIVKNQAALGTNVIGFGEMGIGNTAASSLLYSLLYKEDVELWTGKGTGVAHLDQKIKILKEVQSRHTHLSDIYEIIASVSGAEMAMMIGAMIQAHHSQMIILVDGFIATACLSAAMRLEPEIRESAIFCHLSDENAHERALAKLNANPLLKLGLRLGEGTGVALAYPLLVSATAFLNEMASFESAGISGQK